MDFLSTLILLAAPYGFTPEDVKTLHANYCQNLYWQPNALQKMEKYECHIDEVSAEIQRVQRGEY